MAGTHCLLRPPQAGGRGLIGSGLATPAVSTDGVLLKPLAASTPWISSTGGWLYRVPRDGALAELDPVTLAVRRTIPVAEHYGADSPLVSDTSGHLHHRLDSTHVHRVGRDCGTPRRS
jgi:hypothetical protein